MIDRISAPQEAVDAYPSRCSNCGHRASDFFIPDDYHQRPESERDPGVCTVCGEPFGKEDEYENVLDVREALAIVREILMDEVFDEFDRDEVSFKHLPEPLKIDGDETSEIEVPNSTQVIVSEPDSVVVHDFLRLLSEETVEEIARGLGARIEVFEDEDVKEVAYKFTLERLAEKLPDWAYMSEEELRSR
jgi:hypothetical protein